jgi:hypothetical protein
MAITADILDDPTPYSVSIEATHDGAAGNSVTIANATLVAAMADGPLKRLFEQTYDSASNAQRAILTGKLLGGRTLGDINVVIMPTDSVATVPWSVDIDVDGDDLPRLILGGIAGAASRCIYRLEFRHSITR